MRDAEKRVVIKKLYEEIENKKAEIEARQEQEHDWDCIAQYCGQSEGLDMALGIIESYLEDL